MLFQVTLSRGSSSRPQIFAPDARDASLKRGAVPIILLNGESTVNLMIDKGLGVERVPLYAYYERPGDLTETDED